MSRAYHKFNAAEGARLTPDGALACEPMTVKASEVRDDDIYREVGTVMAVKPDGVDYVVIEGRIRMRRFHKDQLIDILRRNH